MTNQELIEAFVYFSTNKVTKANRPTLNKLRKAVTPKVKYQVVDFASDPIYFGDCSPVTALVREGISNIFTMQYIDAVVILNARGGATVIKLDEARGVTILETEDSLKKENNTGLKIDLSGKRYTSAYDGEAEDYDPNECMDDSPDYYIYGLVKEKQEVSSNAALIGTLKVTYPGVVGLLEEK